MRNRRISRIESQPGHSLLNMTMEIVGSRSQLLYQGACGNSLKVVVVRYSTGLEVLMECLSMKSVTIQVSVLE